MHTPSPTQPPPLAHAHTLIAHISGHCLAIGMSALGDKLERDQRESLATADRSLIFQTDHQQENKQPHITGGDEGAKTECILIYLP